MKQAFAIAVLVAVLALSGCLQPPQGNSELPTGGNGSGQPAPQGNGLVECQDGSFAASQADCIGSGLEPPANTGLEECGFIDIARLATAASLTKQEAASLECFNRRMADCGQASFELTGLFGGLFSVLGTQESDCLISYYDNTDQSLKTCNFPRAFLSKTNSAAVEAGQPRLLVMTVAAAMRGTPYTDPETGEARTADCKQE
jgi:hypothetical protein